MSKLQIALIGLGILIVAGIFLFNRWQERRYRKRAESAFAQRHSDVLMSDAAAPPPAPAARVRDRIEPQLQGLGEESVPSPVAAAGAPPEVAPPAASIDVLKEQIAAELRADRRSKPREEPWAEPAPHAPGVTVAPAEPVVAATAADSGSRADAGRVEPRAIDNVAPSVPPQGAERLDYQLDLVSQTPISHSALDKLLKQLSDLVKRVQLWGAHENQWQTLDIAGAPRYARVRATLQLVSRAGMVSREDLLTFRRALERCAADAEAVLEGPDVDAFVQKAQELEAFCQKADVVVGLNVVARGAGPFAGTKLRAWAEAAGFQLRPNGAFQLNDEHGTPLIVMESQENPGFLPERIRTLTTKGVTLLLDAPVVSDGLHVFDRLVGLARSLATTMGGAVVDDNQAVVSDAGLNQIRATLKKIYDEMEARGIPAGGALAQRLFR